MLDRLLELLREGDTRRISDLARELGTTPDLVRAMMEDLARMGYVKRGATECSEECASCPMSALCVAGSGSQGRRSGQVWVLANESDAS